MPFTTALLVASAITAAQEPVTDSLVLQYAKFNEVELIDLIANSPSETQIHVDLVFRTQPDFEVIKKQLGPISDKDLPRALRDRSLEICLPEQAAALEIMRHYESEGQADLIAPMWLSNVVGVRTTADVILQLAELEDVAYIHYDPPREGTLLSTTSGSAPTCDQDVINSPWAWRHMNATGQGMVVAVIDTGTCYNHTDLKNNIWVNAGEDMDGDGEVWDTDDMNGIDDDGNGYVDDLIGWAFDHTTTTPNNPMDHQTHGTHTSGTVVGDGTAGTQTGVAPGAKVMPLRNSTLISHEIEVWQCMEYAMLMDADIISMSLGWWHSWSPDRATWRLNCKNTQASGVMMVVAAGNEGGWSTFDNVRTPGDVPEVTTVGATDCNDNKASFTSIGPVEWANVAGYNDHPYPPGLIKPDVSAPGVSTISTLACNGYTSMSGTSMSTPHVAGAAAILRSLRPDLSISEVRDALMTTAVDLGAAGKDNTYGAGRIDIEAMLRTYAPLRSDVYEVSAAAGGVVNLSLQATTARAGRPYWVLGSASGNEPGTTFAGGSVLPLNKDWLFDLIMASTNGPVFQNNQGVLDASGKATTTISLTPGLVPASLIGQMVSLAFGTAENGFVAYTSNPVNIDIVL